MAATAAMIAIAMLTLDLSVQRPSLAVAVALIDDAAAAAGLKPVRFEVRGNRYTRPAEVAEALQLETAASQFSFDIEKARRRIEALPWVATAKVQRLLPDAVAVEINERTPAILWRGRDRDILLDISGRELTAVARGTDTGLPVVTGDGAGPSAPAIVSLVRQNAELSRRVVEMRRVESRRWSLHLDSGTLVHLPGDGTAAAVAWLDGQASSGLLDMGLEVIDLRVAGQLVVRAGKRAATRVSEAPASNATPRGSAGGGIP